MARWRRTARADRADPIMERSSWGREVWDGLRRDRKAGLASVGDGRVVVESTRSELAKLPLVLPERGENSALGRSIRGNPLARSHIRRFSNKPEGADELGRYAVISYMRNGLYLQLTHYR